MITYIEYLNMPSKVVIAMVALLLTMNFTGEVLEFKGKVVPEFVKFRKYFQRKKQERKDTVDTFKEVKQLLADVNHHYSEDNITKRNEWMNWVDDRAKVYDASIVEITQKLSDVMDALNTNTKMTEDMFIENSRDRIIDFAEKASDYSVVLSHEQFRRIFRVHECYEKFLAEHNRTNGEVDIAYKMIQDGYAYRIQKHCFAEEIKLSIEK